MEILNLEYPVIARVARNYRRFAQRFQGLGIKGDNGDEGYVANTNTRTKYTKLRTNTKQNNNHYNKYTLYPLIDYVVVFIDVSVISSWRDYWRELIEPQATQGAANGR